MNILVTKLSDSAADGSSINLQELLQSLTLDCLCESLLGVDLGTETTDDKAMIAAALNRSQAVSNKQCSVGSGWAHAMHRRKVFSTQSARCFSCLLGSVACQILQRVCVVPCWQRSLCICWQILHVASKPLPARSKAHLQPSQCPGLPHLHIQVVNRRLLLPCWQVVEVLDGSRSHLAQDISLLRQFAGQAISTCRQQLAAAQALGLSQAMDSLPCGVLPQLLHATGPGGRPLEDEQLISTVLNLLIAGSGTIAQVGTTNACTAGSSRTPVFRILCCRRHMTPVR